MITKFIKYNGITSKDLGLRLIDDISFNSPEHSLDLIEIDGVDGAKIKDNKRLSLVDMKFPFVLYQTNNSTAQNLISTIQNWLLLGNPSWKDFELSWDEEYLYKALFYETFSVEGSINARKRCILNFKVHPIKYLKSGFQKISITKGQVLNNPENRASKPIIKLIGSGDVTLIIGTQIFKLKGVQGHIVLDCETQSAHYDNKEPQYDKVYSYPFPILKPGTNLINWNNADFKVEIIPRWEAIV